jgi:hypothetical protein
MYPGRRKQLSRHPGIQSNTVHRLDRFEDKKPGLQRTASPAVSSAGVKVPVAVISQSDPLSVNVLEG